MRGDADTVCLKQVNV